MSEERPAHSPLGASGAERWINCPGSVALLRNLTLPESDAPDYRTEGTAAHALAAHTIQHPLREAWEQIGNKFGDEGHEHEVDAGMAEAVQVYADFARPLMAKADEAGTRVMIEYPVSSPCHKDFYGTADLAIIIPGGDFHGQENLWLADYKHGEGIQVDVENNPQLMYYAYGVLQEFTEVDKVYLHIVQPRGFHMDGPIRVWETTAKHIREWVATVLVPAMERTEFDNTLDPGSWCRFCPAKLVCPVLNGLFRAACVANPAAVMQVTDASLGRSYEYVQAVKFYLKAMEEEVYRRLNTGKYNGGVVKLVNKKANRVWKPEAPALFKSKFPAECMEKPELKSPAEMEKIGPDAKKLVREYAYTPQTGTTVALLDDPRPAVKVQTAAETFAPALAMLNAADDDLFSAAPADDLEIPAFLQRKA